MLTIWSINFGMEGSLHNFSISRESPHTSRSHRNRSASPTRSPHRQPSRATPPVRSSRGTSRHYGPTACERCRSFKKKCSRTFPVCDLCASAGQRCSYSAPPQTPEAEALQLRARVRWLSEYFNDHVLSTRDRGGIEAIDTGSDLVALLGIRSQQNQGSASLQSIPRNQSAPLSMSYANLSPADVQAGMLPHHMETVEPGVGPSSLDVNFTGTVDTSLTDPDDTNLSGQRITNQTTIDSNNGLASGGSSTGRNFPADASARRFLNAYFQKVNTAYPLVNQSKILENLDTLSGLAQGLRDSQSTLLYLVMSIGCSTLERAGQVSRDTSKRFEVAFAEIIQECVCRDSIESVQILMLLALYSLFDPTGPSAYSIVGIAARQTITLGLTHQLTAEHTIGSVETEQRHRLYWSTFALDRMMATSRGLPLALPDNEDVPFPALTIEEFASVDRRGYARQLQTSRHVIQLRQIEGRILEKVHLRNRSQIAELTPSDRRAVLDSLRTSVEDWYSQGCLMSPMGTDDSTLHSSTAWLSARYYHLLLLLYYPSHFNSSSRAASGQDLLQFTQRQLQMTSVLFRQGQVPLNSNTLCRLLPLCLVLMHDFVATFRSPDWPAQSMFSFQAKDEVDILLSILKTFPENWQLANEVAEVVDQFVGVISGCMEDFFLQDAMFPQATTSHNRNPAVNENSATTREAARKRESIVALMSPCISKLISLMRKILGESTCFQFVEYPEDDGQAGSSLVAAAMPPPLPLPQQSHHKQHQDQPSPAGMIDQMNVDRTGLNSMQRTGMADNDTISFGWGNIDLDFL